MGAEQLPGVEWIIHYSDGSTFCSLDGAPHEAPRDGVQIVQCADADNGRLIWHSSDFYCWQDEWVPRSLLGLMDYLREPGPEKVVLQGRGIKYDVFRSIYHAAVADPRMQFKTGRDQREPGEPA